MNFAKYIVAHILAKFEYFAKQIIFSSSQALTQILAKFLRHPVDRLEGQTYNIIGATHC